MKDKLASAQRKAKNHVVRNRGRYGYIAGFTSAMLLTHKLDRVGQFNAFLEEKGLTAEFYTPED
jgi:hypothetical protein